jgi:uncharacterized phage protein gp47/JayE
MDTLDALGLTIDSLQSRIARIKTTLRGSIDSALNLASNTGLGQIVQTLSDQAHQIAELIQSAYSSFDPDEATGHALTSLALITGTVRRSATSGTVNLRVNLNGGNTLPAGSIAAVTGSSTNRWATDIDVVAPAGPAANYTVAATCITTGQIEAPAGTIIEIVTPFAFWNSVTNLSDATPGVNQEEDDELRERRQNEVSLGGSSSVDSIGADISQIDGVVSSLVYENDRWYTDGRRPPNSIEVVIWDGSPPAVADSDIAEAIFQSKPAGIQAFGTTLATHVDERGFSHGIGFTRATVVNILVELWVIVDSDYVGDSVVKSTIEDLIEGLGVGEDVRRAHIVAAIEPLQGVRYVSCINGGNEVKISRKPAAVSPVDIVISEFEIAMIDVAATDIVVHS